MVSCRVRGGLEDQAHPGTGIANSLWQVLVGNLFPRSPESLEPFEVRGCIGLTPDDGKEFLAVFHAVRSKIRGSRHESSPIHEPGLSMQH